MGKISSLLYVSTSAYPSSFLPPCYGKSPGNVQFAGSSSTSLLQITRLFWPLPGRKDLTSWVPIPPYSISCIGGPRSSTTSGGQRWLLAIHHPSQWAGVLGILRASLFPVVAHMLRMTSPPLPLPLALPDSVSSYQLPTCIVQWWGGGGSDHIMTHPCHIWVSGCGNGYLPTESIFCTTRGSAQSESRD